MIPSLPKKMSMPKPPKKFELAQLGNDGHGKKIIVYGVTGLGKTTLCSLLPNPAFISLDGGAEEICHPVTGEHLQGVNVESFQDTRDILHSNIFESAETIVIDHITELQHLAQEATFDRVTKPKNQGGGRAENIEAYGFHKGYRHWHDTMRLILPDCDRLLRTGKNIVMIAQESISKSVQTDVEDFVKLGPDLYQDNSVSILNAYMSWASHVFRINYANLVVTDGKASATKTRQVHVHGDATFYAKSRTIPSKYDIVEFTEPADDGIWRLLFGGE